MVKKQNRHAHLNAKRVGTTKSGCPINLPNKQIETDEELTLRLEIDGELVWKTFPRSAEGWRDAMEVARGDAQFMESMSSIESAKACGFKGWFLQLAIEEGLIPDSFNEPMVTDSPSV